MVLEMGKKESFDVVYPVRVGLDKGTRRTGLFDVKEEGVEVVCETLKTTRFRGDPKVGANERSRGRRRA